MVEQYIRYIIFLFTVFYSLRLHGQENKFGYFIYPEPTKNYHYDFQKILNVNLKEDYIVRFTVQPEFDSEYAFQIKEVDSNLFKISAIVLHRNLWYFNQNANSIKVNLFTMSIEKELFLKIDRLFPNLANGHVRCTDIVGSAYCFRRQICSKSNVDIEVDLFKLATICDLIMDYATGKDIDMDYITKQIDELIFKME